MITKQEAKYVDRARNGKEPCRDCSMFKEPNSCTLVKGVILPGGHCRYWEAKNKLPVKE